MLNEQKKMIVFSNQNVEVAEFLYSIKKTLVGSGCRENFSGLSKEEVKDKTKYLKYLTHFQNGSTGILRKFYIGREHSRISETGLTIREYRITSSENSQKDNQESLQVIFDRNYDGEILVKNIPLYFSLYENGRIKTCSLSPILHENETWESHNGSLFLTRYLKLRINEGKSVQELNLSGSLYVEGIIESCTKENAGSFTWNEEKKQFYLCHENELISLTDDEDGALP